MVRPAHQLSSKRRSAVVPQRRSRVFYGSRQDQNYCGTQEIAVPTLQLAALIETLSCGGQDPMVRITPPERLEF